jgi:hypothetical protein
MHLLLVRWAGLGRLEHNCEYPRNNYELCFDVVCCELPNFMTVVLLMLAFV